MKDFTNFGLRKRIFPEYNYNSIWGNLKTIRFGEEIAKELPPNRAEFYDVGINTKCNAECEFCYVSASKSGVNYENICDTWDKWMNTFPEDIKAKRSNIILTEKPYQITIGSTGEATIHPEFTKFLNVVYHSKIVPNYTTNGIFLSDTNDKSEELLEVTRRYVGGVAVSLGNSLLSSKAHITIEKLLLHGNTNVNINHLISNNGSVDKLIEEIDKYNTDIAYHILLPLMKSGRSEKGINSETWEYLENLICKKNIKNIAFGAHFSNNLKDSKIKTWLYPPESLSKNIILEKDCVKITPSSFNLIPIEIINL